jgi:hypothetical protein
MLGVWVSAESEVVSFRATSVQYNALISKNHNYLNFNHWTLLFGILCAAVRTLITLTFLCNYGIQCKVQLLSKQCKMASKTAKNLTVLKVTLS